MKSERVGWEMGGDDCIEVSIQTTGIDPTRYLPSAQGIPTCTNCTRDDSSFQIDESPINVTRIDHLVHPTSPMTHRSTNHRFSSVSDHIQEYYLQSRYHTH